MIRALIVDDEPDARERVRRLLGLHPDIEIAGEAADGEEALHIVGEQDIDLVFLDVQMPLLDGFSVAELLPASRMPVLVFCTAFDEYALRAFDVHAVDYLLKPFDRARFDRALEKARAAVAASEHAQPEVAAMLASARGTPYRKRIAVRGRGRTLILRVEAIDWIEAQGSYVRIHTGKQSYLIRESMRELEASLNPARFLRVHRSAIVQLDRIDEVKTDAHGELRIVLTGGTIVPVGRAFRASLEAALGVKL
jgi:two-component system LytT family response regulator